jgi:phosphatidylethanolamine-binding protein (PEBP) family uncharacterized protein
MPSMRLPRLGWAVIISALALLASCLSTCASQPAGSSSITEGSDSSIPAAATLLGTALPPPARLVSAVIYPPKAMGKDYLIDAAHANCMVSGELMTFNPDWDSAQHPGLTGAAYCIYAVGAGTGIVDAKLTLTWAGAGPAAGEAWLALSDFVHQSWEWRQLDGTELAFNGVSSYADADGNVYVALVLLGTAELTLDNITLLDNGGSGGFTVTSEAGVDGGTLPVEYTADGAGNSPALAWENAPEGTTEYCLMMTTLPIDGSTKWDWVLYHIPGTATGIVKNSVGVGVLGVTTKGTMVYEPPASQGPGPKLYTFTVYALSAAPQLPDVPEEVTGAVLTQAIAGITLASDSVNLTYTRQ